MTQNLEILIKKQIQIPNKKTNKNNKEGKNNNFTKNIPKSINLKKFDNKGENINYNNIKAYQSQKNTKKMIIIILILLVVIILGQNQINLTQKTKKIRIKKEKLKL